MKGMVNEQDVNAIIKAQKSSLKRLEKSNAMLTNCNDLSSQQLAIASVNFTRHTNMLLEMQKDLKSIFTRIRTLKSKLKTQYPGQFSMALEEEVQNVAMQTTDIKNEDSTSSNSSELYSSAAQSHFSNLGEGWICQTSYCIYICMILHHRTEP